MANLVIEDGAGRPNAECVNSIEVADAYFLARSVNKWAVLTDDAKAASLRVASEYLVEIYATKLSGVPTVIDQALCFPRTDCYANGVLIGENTIPQVYKAAELYLALQSLDGPLWVVTDPNAPVLIERTTGPLTRKWAKPGGDGSQVQKQFDRVAALLAAYINNASPTLGQLRVSRA